MTTQQLKDLQPWIWMGIFAQALLATFGSLYYSTFGDIVTNFHSGTLFPVGEGLIPCELCWYARILMYPIVLLSYVGIAKKDRRFTDYLIPLVALGISLELYHYAIQKLPIPTFFTCSNVNPCNALQVNYLGFITIPFLALMAFVILAWLIGANMYINHRLDSENIVEKVKSVVSKTVTGRRKRSAQ